MSGSGRDEPGLDRPGVHPSAIVHPGARLGDDVYIGPWSLVGEHVVVGSGCRLGAHVVLENRVTLGEGNQVLHGAVLGSTPQDLKYDGAPSEVVVGDHNTIREYATVNIATAEGEVTRIGSHCLLMAYSHVAHNCVLGDHVIMANSVNIAGHVEVDDHAIIGGMTAVHQFVVIGAHSFVGGHSRISQDVPPYVKVAGSPPQPAGINSLGLERRGFSADEVGRAKEAYRLLYRRGLRSEEARGHIVDGSDDRISRTFEAFFARSQRGIVR